MVRSQLNLHSLPKRSSIRSGNIRIPSLHHFTHGLAIRILQRRIDSQEFLLEHTDPWELVTGGPNRQVIGNLLHLHARKRRQDALDLLDLLMDFQRYHRVMRRRRSGKEHRRLLAGYTRVYNYLAHWHLGVYHEAIHQLRFQLARAAFTLNTTNTRRLTNKLTVKAVHALQAVTFYRQCHRQCMFQLAGLRNLHYEQLADCVGHDERRYYRVRAIQYTGLRSKMRRISRLRDAHDLNRAIRFGHFVRDHTAGMWPSTDTSRSFFHNLDRDSIAYLTE